MANLLHIQHSAWKSIAEVCQHLISPLGEDKLIVSAVARSSVCGAPIGAYTAALSVKGRILILPQIGQGQCYSPAFTVFGSNLTES